MADQAVHSNRHIELARAACEADQREMIKTERSSMPCSAVWPRPACQRRIDSNQALNCLPTVAQTARCPPQVADDREALFLRRGDRPEYRGLLHPRDGIDEEIIVPLATLPGLACRASVVC